MIGELLRVRRRAADEGRIDRGVRRCGGVRDEGGAQTLRHDALRAVRGAEQREIRKRGRGAGRVESGARIDHAEAAQRSTETDPGEKGAGGEGGGCDRFSWELSEKGERRRRRESDSPRSDKG